MLSNNAGQSGNCVCLTQYFLKTILLILGLSLATPLLFAENEMAADPVASQNRSGNPDFSFSAPKGFVGFHFGRLFPRADSDLFEMITSELTLEKSDFQSWDVGFDGGANLHERFDLIFSFDYTRRTKASESRDFVDENDLPITQTTRLQQFPLTGGVKVLLVPRGSSVGRYAWLPSAVVPYIGGGVGVLWYKLEMEGDFVDESTLEIFSASIRSSGWTPTFYAGGGTDIHVFKNAFLTIDLRYVWARPELDRDFVSFDTLDLSGFRLSGGLQFHF